MKLLGQITCFVSLTGETADFYAQPAPTPWEVQTKTPELFTKHTEEVRVPYTSNIKVTVF